MKTNRMLDPRNAALLEKHKAVLTDAEFKALNLRALGWTFAKIAMSGITSEANTRQRIQQIERRALAKLERAEVME